MTSPRPTVTILYGFAEGKWRGRKLRSCLREAGFALSNSPDKTDIIIAHSGGSYDIPRQTTAKLALHVGYPFWPGRSIGSSLKKQLAIDRTQHGTAKWLLRCTIHDLHILNLRRSLAIRANHKAARHDQIQGAAKNVFVNYQADPYCYPKAIMKLFGTTPSYISLGTGGHMDIWDNPGRIVEMIQSLYEQRP